MTIALIIPGALCMLLWIISMLAHSPIVLRFSAVGLLAADAVTVFPFVLCAIEPSEGLLRHETSHWHSQRAWALWFGIGLIAWWLVYLLVLPVGWNLFRYREEARAYRASTPVILSDERIREIMRGKPYYLWWM